LSQSSPDDGFDLDIKARSFLTESVAIIACVAAGLLVYFGAHAPSAGRHPLIAGQSPCPQALKTSTALQPSMVHVRQGNAAIVWP
jgi:hypothetical protein